MATREIRRDEWVKSLDDFSKHHLDWIVTLEILGTDIGDQEEASGLPLVGISADVKDRESRIEVIVGGRLDAHLTHVINKAKRVWLREPDVPGHEAVAVESEDGTTTVVHFHHVSPEQAERQLPGKG
jgi:hypothetical protein